MCFPSKRVFAALVAVALWSTNAWAASIALTRMSVGWLLLVQYAAAAGVLLVARAVGRRRPGKTSGRPSMTGSAAAIGVVGLTATIFLQYLSFAAAPIVAASVLAYSWPLLAALWVAATRRTRQATRLAGLALLGFGGVALIFSGPVVPASQPAGGPGAAWGYAAALGSAVFMAVYTLASSRVHASATDILIPATVVGTLVAAAVTASTSSSWPQPTGLLAAAYIGLGPMAAGFGLWTVAMARSGAERLGPIGYVTPLLSTLLLLATGAPSTATTLIGVSLVLACSIGVLAAQHPSSSARSNSVRADPGS